MTRDVELQQTLEITHRQGNDKDGNALKGGYFHDYATTTLAKLGKNETVSMEVLLKICKVLECNVGDIMDVINEETTDGNE